jgi:putative membrane protein
MKFVLRLIINAVSLYLAIYLLRGSYIFPSTDQWVDYIWLALIFGLVNAFLRPLAMVVSCPVIILTLGLGTLLVNTLLFWLSGLIGNQFGVGFTVNGFFGAFLGALIVSVVSFILSLVLAPARD